MNRVFFIFFLLVGSQQFALAACETNRFGVVYCGRGDCAKDKAGDVEYYGGCEKASALVYENEEEK